MQLLIKLKLLCTGNGELVLNIRMAEREGGQKGIKPGSRSWVVECPYCDGEYRNYILTIFLPHFFRFSILSIISHIPNNLSWYLLPTQFLNTLSTNFWVTFLIFKTITGQTHTSCIHHKRLFFSIMKCFFVLFNF